MKNKFFYCIKSLFAIIMMTFTLSAMAQDVTVTGTVTDAKGAAMPGVAIKLKGTTKGTQTDANGAYKLNDAPSNGSLIFSFVGMTTQEVAIAGKSILDVTLAEDTKKLDEVVVVGYGTQKRKEVSGTVTSVSSKNFLSGVVTNPMAALEGKVSGLVITQSSGDPNSAPTVRLRGTGSLTAGSDPLYVVDGVVGVPATSISPDDIASIDVLRDASSAAIYGARGANGVIMITTKRGKSGETIFDYSAFVGMDNISQKPDLMNRDQYMAAASSLNQKVTDYGGNTDWLKTITRTAYTQNHNLGISGGSANSSYRASLGYLNQDGTVIGSGKERLNARLNFDARGLKDKLAVKVNLSAIRTNADIAQNIALGTAQNMLPSDPVYNTDGTYFQVPGTFSNYNPLAIVNNRKSHEITNDIIGNVQLNYSIIEGLVAGLSGTMRTQAQDNSFYQNNVFSAAGVPLLPPFNNSSKNYGVRLNNNTLDKQLEATLAYSKKFENSKLNLLGGYTYQDVISDGFGVGNNNFINDATGADNIGSGIGNFSTYNLLGSYKNEYKLISFLGRAQYTLADKYFATVNLRRDGSTKFGENNRWGFFPSASIGWQISSEDFMKTITAVDNLKLRISWGQTGNSNGINPNQALSFYGPASAGNYFNGSSWTPSYGITSNANPNLKWEVNENYGAGLDFSLFKSKLSGSIDWYTRTTKDLLYNIAVNPTPQNPFPTTLMNIGSMQNQGVEMTFDYNWINTSKFTWHSIVTASFNSNKVVSLSGNGVSAPDQIFLSSSLGNFIRGTSAVNFSVLQAGQPVGVFYGAVVDHIEGGKYVFKDLNGDGKVDPEGVDRTYIGNPNPTFVGALTNSFTYGNWDLSLQLTSQLGAKVMNTNRMLMGRTDGRIPDSNGLNGSATSGINDNRTISMDYYVESGDFLRLNNATIGYKLPIKGLLRRARVYVAGSNLALITGYKGVDPLVSQNLQINATNGIAGVGGTAASAPGIDTRDTYFKTRTFTCGVSLSF